MRVLWLWAIALLLSVIPAVPSAKDSLAASVAKSAGGAIGEAVAKELAGQFYDVTCTTEATKDPTTKYVCGALAGFSGREEDEWKAEIKKELAEINVKLAAIEDGQKRLQHDLTRNHAEVYRLFQQAAAKQLATQYQVDIEALWGAYRRQFDEDLSDVNHDAMVKLAQNILGKDLNFTLAKYNQLLTKPFESNQSLLRYAFFDFKEKDQFRAPPEAFNHNSTVDALYDTAEKLFVDMRARQEKASLMVLWAIKILESDCEIKGQSPCATPPPFSSAKFRKDYDAYAKDQLIAFNEGLDWLLVTYGDPHAINPWFLREPSEDYLTRANFLNAAIVGGGNGMWGRVIAMGNAWDGSISMQCGAKSGIVKPRFSYLVPVDGRDKPSAMDWWVSRSGNDVYDEVRFAKNWTVYHYYIPDAKEGSCTVSQSLPGKGRIPWVQPGTAVVKAKTSGNRDVVFGSFIAVQRAGGTYAMASGEKWYSLPPTNSGAGTTANIKNERFDSLIDTNGPLPRASVLFEGRGEYKAFSGGRVRRHNKIDLHGSKYIYFPEDRDVKLGLLQSPDCAKACRNSLSSEWFILNYDIERGKLGATVSVLLSPLSRDSSNLNPSPGGGVVIDRSFDFTADRKVMNVDGGQYGSLKTSPKTGYQLSYEIEFDLTTETNGMEATHWMYRGKITPHQLFLTK